MYISKDLQNLEKREKNKRKEKITEMVDIEYMLEVDTTIKYNPKNKTKKNQVLFVVLGLWMEAFKDSKEVKNSLSQLLEILALPLTKLWFVCLFRHTEMRIRDL